MNCSAPSMASPGSAFQSECWWAVLCCTTICPQSSRSPKEPHKARRSHAKAIARETLHPPGTSLVCTLQGHKNWVHSMALSDDVRRAISASDDQTFEGVGCGDKART